MNNGRENSTPLQRNFFQRIPLTLKMVLVTLLVGLVVWSVQDYIQIRTLKKVFQAQLKEKLSQLAMEDRLKFDHQIKTYSQSVRLFITQKSFSDYLDKQEWSKEDVIEVKYHRQPPQWFPPTSVLRIFAKPRFAFLLDAHKRVREVYQPRQEVPPPSLLRPMPILIEKTHGQGLVTALEGIPYLITSESFLSAKGELRAILMLASPIDDEFLFATFGVSPLGHMLALLSSETNPRIIASSDQEKLPSGTPVDALRDKYIVMGKAFFDYGAAEVSIKLASFTSREEVKELTNSVIKHERQGHAISASVFILSFVLIMFWITRRIQRLSQNISAFSQESLGVEQAGLSKGDQLHILEEKFQRLMDEVLISLKNLLKISLQDITLEGILEQFIQEIISIPWLGLEPQAAIFLVEDDSNILTLVAEQGLTRPLLDRCARVPFGKCLCGEAASTGEVVFADHLDERHEYSYENIAPHGHYCVPIISSEENKVLGVFNLFLKEGFRFNKANEEFFLLAVAKLANIIKRKQAEVALKQAKQSLEKQNEELKSLDKMKDGLVHDVSHELKTPVAKQKMELDLLEGMLRKHGLHEESKKMIKSMRSSVKRQERVITNILNLSRLEAGGRKYDIKPLRLDLIIEGVLHDYKLATDAHNIEVEKNLPTMTINSDHEMLYHVFSNLINNAIKYRSQRVTPYLKFFLEKRAEQVVIKISDNGMGLTKEEKERAFDKFYQASAASPGSGIGLAIVKKIVEDLDGKINLESAGRDKGATFEVVLPLSVGKKLIDPQSNKRTHNRGEN